MEKHNTPWMPSSKYRGYESRWNENGHRELRPIGTTESYQDRKRFYIDNVLAPWADKFGISLETAARIVTDQSPGVVYRNLFDYVEHQQFCTEILESYQAKEPE